MYTGAESIEQVVREQSSPMPLFRAEVAKKQSSRTQTSSWYISIKIVAEWMIALVLAILTAPLMLLIALTVKATSKGPAFYLQTRLGLNGKHYKIIKLRTMVCDAEALTGPVWAAKRDRRITPLGEILRRTHMDELPQLLNVLHGDMGLIGPRPERPEIATQIQRVLPEYDDTRLKVRPGITGLSQMLVPADDPHDPKMRNLRRKLAHDLYYVENANFFLDVRIAMSTFCYFLGAALDSIQGALVRSHGNIVRKNLGHLLAEEDRTSHK
jgi:lipopolysaccharide/colanic/teichoic acid biosynthesis glycosyltransferase